jgi:hypothetical protein
MEASEDERGQWESQADVDACLQETGVTRVPESRPFPPRTRKDRLAASYADIAPEGPSANRSLSTVEPVCGTPKWKLENGAQRPAPETRPARTEIPKIAGQRLGRASLTRGNVADSHPPGNNTPETGLRGWVGRIRTPTP